MRGRLRLVAFAAVLVVMVTGLAGSAVPAARGSSVAVAAEPSVLVAGPQGLVEDLSLRTRFSRTYRGVDGQPGELETVVSGAPVNYLDASGVWQPIDTGLSASGGGFHNGPNSFGLQLPASLPGAVQLSSGGDSLSFTLLGAKGSGSVAGSAAVFGGALPGVDARYLSIPDGVKEELTLASKTSTSTFTYAFSLSGGLSLASAGTGAVVRGADGAIVFSVSGAFARDAAGALGPVSTSLGGTASAPTLTYTVDPAWLASPERRFPVVVDPSSTIGGAADCTLAQAAPSTSQCAASTDQVGFDGTNASRSVLYFGTTAVPADAIVANAELKLYLGSEANSTPVSLGVYPLTRSFTQSATWNSYDGSNAWSGAGGDYDSGNGWTASSVGGTTGQTISIYPTAATVQGWVATPSSNHGLLVKEPTENQSNVLSFNSSKASSNQPQLVVYWRYRVGLQRQYSYQDFPLTDRMGMKVNIASGNLLVSQTDLHFSGVGMDLNLTRTYSNMSETFWKLGRGWQTNGAPFLYLNVYGNGDVRYVDPSGAEVLFTANGTGYTPPTGIDATLTKDASTGKFSLTYNGGETMHFNSWGGLLDIKDKHNNTITYNYSSGGAYPIVSVTDTHGNTVTYNYNTGNSLITGLTYGTSGPTVSYGYNTSNYLTTYTDAAGGVTHYAYNSWGDMSQITTPAGRVISMTYYDGAGTPYYYRVHTVSQTDTTVTPNVTSTWTFTYNTGNTVVTDPLGHSTSYTIDSQDRTTQVTDALSLSSSTSYASSGFDDSNPIQQTNAAGGVTDFSYDTTNSNVLANTNLSRVQGPATAGGQRATSSATYTDTSNPYFATASHDAQGHAWSYTYDSTYGDALTKAEGDSPGANPVSYAYNPDGTVKSITDAKGTGNSACSPTSVTICDSYDSSHNLQTITYPSPASNPLGTEQFTWDALNRLASTTDGKSQQTTYSYDGTDINHSMDRLKQVSFAGSHTLTYSYDADGKLTSQVESPGGATSYTYDDLGRMKTETKPGGTTITYSYDANSNLASITENSQTTSYTYDQINRLTGITEPGSGGNSNCTDTSITICISYPDEFHSTVTYPGNAQAQSSYDNAGRLVSIVNKNGAGTTVASYTYTHTYTDGSGATQDGSLRQSVTTLSGTSYYCYDPTGRLASAGATTGSCATSAPWGNSSAPYQYAYDPNGNMTSKTINGTTTYYTVNTANEVCLSSTSSGGSCPTSSLPWTYDANGNLTKSPDYTTLAYNTLDQTTSITPSGGSAISAGYVNRGQFDRTSLGSSTFLNDSLGLARETASSTNTDYTRTPGAGTYSENIGGSHYYYAFDGLGSIVGLFNASGGYVQDAGTNYTAVYEPYGKLTNPPGSTYAALFKLRYAGYQYDTQTGLYKVGARYYNPNTGRWTQRDPIDDPFTLTGWNRYDYAGDDPINMVDPTGECVLCVVDKVVGAIGQAAGTVGLVCTAAAVAEAGANPASDACAGFFDTVSLAASAWHAARHPEGKGFAGFASGTAGVFCDNAGRIARRLIKPGRYCSWAAGIATKRLGG
jgi:RHS repeat-associated protein